MSRTRRRKKHADDNPSKIERDGRGGIFGMLRSLDFTREVRRRDRRTRDAEADKLERDAVDADDVPVAPKPRRLWQFWKGW